MDGILHSPSSPELQMSIKFSSKSLNWLTVYRFVYSYVYERVTQKGAPTIYIIGGVHEL